MARGSEQRTKVKAAFRKNSVVGFVWRFVGRDIARAEELGDSARRAAFVMALGQCGVGLRDLHPANDFAGKVGHDLYASRCDSDLAKRGRGCAAARNHVRNFSFSKEMPVSHRRMVLVSNRARAGA